MTFLGLASGGPPWYLVVSMQGIFKLPGFEPSRRQFSRKKKAVKVLAFE
jgi:hypothetical protein